jgi:hypothetical protein
MKWEWVLDSVSLACCYHPGPCHISGTAITYVNTLYYVHNHRVSRVIAGQTRIQLEWVLDAVGMGPGSCEGGYWMEWEWVLDSNRSGF